MKPVISVELMRQSDAHTIKTKISSRELMYNAGKSVFETAGIRDNSIIVCGSGNNAGDGYVIALEMAKAGLKCTLLLLGDKFSEDGLYYFNKCKDEGIPHIYADENTSFSQYNDIVDCIFGTGFKGEPKGICADVIDKINQSGKRTVSVDINSGLCGDNGRYVKCVKSSLTVSIGYLKTGFFLGDAPKVIGKLANADIGIELCDRPYYLVEKEEDLPQNYTCFELPVCENPVEELIKHAKGRTLRWENIVTDGKDTYIFAGDTYHGN